MCAQHVNVKLDYTRVSGSAATPCREILRKLLLRACLDRHYANISGGPLARLRARARVRASTCASCSTLRVSADVTPPCRAQLTSYRTRASRPSTRERQRVHTDSSARALVCGIVRARQRVPLALPTRPRLGVVGTGCRIPRRDIRFRARGEGGARMSKNNSVPSACTDSLLFCVYREAPAPTLGGALTVEPYYLNSTVLCQI